MDPVARLALGFLAGVGLAPFLEPQLAIAGGLAAALGLTASVSRRPSAVAPALALLLGTALVWVQPPGPELRGPLSLRGAVVGSAGGRLADLKLATGGRVRVQFPDRAPALGTAVLVHGTGVPIDQRPVLPGAPDGLRNAQRTGLRTLVFAKRWRRIGPERSSTELPSRRHSPVLRALITGDRRGISEATWTRLRNTGTSHLLAISGFHVGLVAALGAGLARICLRPLSLLRDEGLPEGPPIAAAAIASALAYTLGAGAPVSAQRAVLMVTAVALARASGRGIRSMAVLGLAAMTVVIVDPAAIGTPGFQLSFGAVAGLIRVVPWLTRLIPPDLPRPVSWALQSMAVTIAATLGTLPAAAWWFQSLAPLSPLANLIAIPVVALGVVPCAATAHYGPAALQPLAATLGSGLVEILLAVLALFDVPPLHPAVGPGGALLGAAVLLLPRRLSAAGLALLVFPGGGSLPDEALHITFLDVGQGDAALIAWPSGERWLIDGGRPSDAVVHWLRRSGHQRLDVVVATHGDADHAGGLLPVLRELEVGALWVPTADGLDPLLWAAWERGIPVVQDPPAAIHPGPSFAEPSPNERSLVLLVEHAGFRTLFTGDIERDGEAEVLRHVGPVDLLKVPHHGSRTSSTPAFLDRLSPSLGLISVGRGNWYGHPASRVVKRYEDRGISLLRTDELGTIELAIDARGTRLRSHRGGQGWTGWRPLTERRGPPPRSPPPESPRGSAPPAPGSSAALR